MKTIACLIVYFVTVVPSVICDPACNTEDCQRIHQSLRRAIIANSRRQICAKFYQYLECLNRDLRACTSKLETAILTVSRTHHSLVVECNVQMPSLADFRDGDPTHDSSQDERRDDDRKREDIDEQFDSFKGGTSKPGNRDNSRNSEEVRENNTTEVESRDDVDSAEDDEDYITGSIGGLKTDVGQESTTTGGDWRANKMTKNAVSPRSGQDKHSNSSAGGLLTQQTGHGVSGVDDFVSSKMTVNICLFSTIYSLTVAFRCTGDN